MADFSELARQILNATRVASDARQATPGKPVTVSVIPGFTNTIPSVVNLTGTSSLPAGGLSTITETLVPLITRLDIAIEYTVTDKAGTPVASNQFSTNPPLVLPLPAGQSHPLQVEFLLKPPIGEDIKRTPAIEFVIQVDVTVAVDGNIASTKNPPLQPLKVPVSIPAISIPAVLVLVQHSVGDSDYPGDALCIVRSASPLRSLDLVVKTLNDLAEIISTVRDLIGLVGIANPIEGIDSILDVFQRASIVYFSVGGAPDFNEFGGWDVLGFGGFDDEASSALLLGVTGTQARVWSSEDFSDSDWHEHSTFTVPDLGVENGLPAVGFGVFRNDDFGDYDTDPGDSMNDDIESARIL
jgi:hypothetical protein